MKESLSAKKRRLGLGPLTKAIMDEYDDHLPEKQFMIKPYVAKSPVKPQRQRRETPSSQSVEPLRNSRESSRESLERSRESPSRNSRD